MSYQLGMRHLQYFITVADTLHFRKAAEQLYISQPGLSKQIEKLENELGVKLFDRNNRNVKLTSAGAYLKEELAVSLRNIEDILSHAKLINDGKAGRIHMAYVGSAMQNVIPALMIEFRKKHPTVRFNLKEMDNESQIKGLMTQEIDIGFVRMDKVPIGLTIRPFIKDTFSVVLPQDHPISASNFQSLSQLKDEPYILFDKNYSPDYYEKVMGLFEQENFVPSISHRTVHAYSVFKLVEQHFGISIVPTSLQMGYNLNVKFIELQKVPQRAVLSVVWNKNNRNPILEKILSFIPLSDKAL
ncbi:MAG: LysR family transcriptional regulator [Saprospiraceae bacterium]